MHSSALCTASRCRYRHPLPPSQPTQPPPPQRRSEVHSSVLPLPTPSPATTTNKTAAAAAAAATTATAVKKNVDRPTTNTHRYQNLPLRHNSPPSQRRFQVHSSALPLPPASPATTTDTTAATTAATAAKKKGQASDDRHAPLPKPSLAAEFHFDAEPCTPRADNLGHI